MKVNQWIKLKGLTGHGKNRIREHGEDWKIKAMREGSLMLQSKNETFKVGTGAKAFMVPDGRWIKIHDDQNFEIINEESE